MNANNEINNNDFSKFEPELGNNTSFASSFSESQPLDLGQIPSLPQEQSPDVIDDTNLNPVVEENVNAVSTTEYDSDDTEIALPKISEDSPGTLNFNQPENANLPIENVTIQTPNLNNQENLIQAENADVKPYNALSDVNINFDKKNNENKYVQKPKGMYYSYSMRVATFAVLLVVLLFTSYRLAVNSVTSVDEERVNYTEKSNLNYQVFLKDNNFYDNNYLDQNMVYVASLIDNINVIFNYDFVSDKDIELLFNYRIVARVVIYDESEKNIFYQKEYPLLEEQSVKIENGKFRNISEIVDIDYAKYNTIANEFKNTYGLETVSKLLIELDVDKINAKTSKPVADDNANIVLSIPLSERAINIKMDYKDINNQSEIINDASLTLSNYILMILAIIVFAGGIFAGVNLVLLLIKLLPRPNAFDEYIEKIMREYDRLIVTTTTKPNLAGKKCETIRIHSFDEILDVRDNLKIPVMWYLISPHNKGCFYIKDNNTIYIYYVKKSLLEKKKEK